jgi:hypothetical protein
MEKITAGTEMHCIYGLSTSLLIVMSLLSRACSSGLRVALCRAGLFEGWELESQSKAQAMLE